MLFFYLCEVFISITIISQKNKKKNIHRNKENTPKTLLSQW